jgi:hypothetical protein
MSADDTIPAGYIRLDEAFLSLLRLMNECAGCDPDSGSPASWHEWVESESDPRDEWGARMRRQSDAERRIWNAVTRSGALELHTRHSTTANLERVGWATLAKAGRHQSLVCGRLIFAGHDEKFGKPLFVKAAGWDSFMKASRSELAPPSAKAEKDCAKWLRGRFETGDRRSKRKLEEDALRDYPRLSARGFERVWKEVAPEHARRPGRRAQRPLVGNRRT